GCATTTRTRRHAGRADDAAADAVDDDTAADDDAAADSVDDGTAADDADDDAARVGSGFEPGVLIADLPPRSFYTRKGIKICAWTCDRGVDAGVVMTEPTGSTEPAGSAERAGSADRAGSSAGAARFEGDPLFARGWVLTSPVLERFGLARARRRLV